MAMIIYKPNYSIDRINQNFANKRSNDDMNTFISNNFTVDNTNLSSTVNTTDLAPQPPVNMSLVAQIMTDYGDGPISTGLEEALVIINQNVQMGSFVQDNIFGNYVLAGATTDFRFVTDAEGTAIVVANLQMTTLLPYAPVDYQISFNAIMLNIVRDLRKGSYDPTNYESSVKSQSRKIAKIINQKYG